MPTQSLLIEPGSQGFMSDWTEWAIYWAQFTDAGLYLRQPLGAWIAPTHRRWQWFYDVLNDVVEELVEGGVDFYHPSEFGSRTRAHLKPLERHMS